MRNQTSLSDLFSRYVNNECSPEEIELLLQHFDAREDESLLKNLIRDRLNADEEKEESLNPILHHAFLSIKEQIRSRNSGNSPVIYFTGGAWKRYAVAAAIIIAVGSSAGFLLMKPGPLAKSPVATALTTQSDILPGSNRAMLTLADGSTIVLDAATNGSLASQGNIKVIKLTDGQLSYQTSSADENSHSAAAGNLYNTITTPKGGQYQVVLPDSSVVWLNAASSLRFPVSFAYAARRMVELTGEAYFEIAKNSSAPFTVKHGGTEVQVLGTSFNMNAYTDEDVIRTTLLEGSVKVVQQSSAAVLKPGQQASVAHDNDNTVNHVIRVQQADTEDAVAWKNGLFVFNNADIQSIMRQISRWYDVEVRFEGKLPVDKFVGEVPRNSKVSEVLKIIELNNIHFKISGKTITLLP